MEEEEEGSSAGAKATAPIEGTFTVLERSKILMWITRALAILGPLFLLGLIAKVFPFGMFGFHLLIFSGLLSRSQHKNNFNADRVERNVRITREGVWINGKLEVRREKIADGYFQPRAPRNPHKKRSLGSSVRLFDKSKNVVFEVEADEEKALDILRQLGLDPTRKRAQFRGASPVNATLARNLGFVWGSVTLCVAAALLSGALGLRPFSPFIAFLVFVPVMATGMWPSRIEVGVDGILVTWLWRKKFIPMAQITGAKLTGENQIDVQLATGKVETIYIGSARTRGPFALQQREAVLARIREAHAAYTSGGPTVDVAALVGRGSRTRSEWVSALMKLRGHDGGYRQAVVRDEDLWRLVEDPAAPEDARAGAVMALRPVLDDAGKTRVRVAAEATASPKLRVALDAAAASTSKGGDDDALTTALHELVEEAEEAEEKARSRSAAR